MSKNKYSDWSKDQLIEELLKLKKRKNFGLVWEEKPEDVVEQCKHDLPVLEAVTGKTITTGIDAPTNLIIEGDNFHALSVLNYTHTKKVDVIYIDPPYNTGAKDWKYNNNYVDENDSYRHSKWLSLMNKRILLGRKLLKPNGVLIVTIDDYELPNITALLNDLGAKSLGRVSICIKPEGRRQSKYIMEAHEYALFVSWGNPTIRGLNADFGLDFPEQDEVSKFRWEGLMRRDAGREDRGSNYWYAFYVSKEGDISTVKRDGDFEVLPINAKGIERVWLWDKDRAEENKSQLRAVVRKDKVTIYYKRREQGRVKPTSFWYGSKYNANAYGTRMLQRILPETHFDYPKSIYSVLDCIDLFLPENGLVLDFFAGSGTTGHAALILNSQDGGSRKFILCTNNENGIAEEVCYPRIKRVIEGFKDQSGSVEGLGGNLRYYKTLFVNGDNTDKGKRNLVNYSTDMLCLKEACFDLIGSGSHYKMYKSEGEKYMGIVYDDEGIDEYKNEVRKLGKHVNTYVFSLDDSAREEEFEDMLDLVDLKPIPEVILNVYRRIFK